MNSYERSVQLIRTLKEMSLSDGQLATEEKDYIYQVGKHHGLSSDVVRAELQSPGKSAIQPKTEHERMEVLYHLVFLMKSDEAISLEEKQAIHHYGLKLGFREELLRNFIHLAQQHRTGHIPVTSMLDVIRKFLN